MAENYIQKVLAHTPTRLWINNPTGEELQKALAVGAISGTTNPSYCSSLLKREPGYIGAIIDEVIGETEDPDAAADLVYQRATARFMEAFLPLYERSGATQGFVTMQDNPSRDEDPKQIVDAAHRHRHVGRNYMAKIPATEAGMEAMAALIQENMPICATECFSIAQAVAVCELYEKMAKKGAKSPPFFITHITGIFDEELREYADKHKLDIQPGLLAQAGCIVARKQYALIKARGYRAVLLGGGARGMQHFTEFVGGDLHITLNWNTIDDLIRSTPEMIPKIQVQANRTDIDELLEKLPYFRTAYSEDALEPKDFKNIAALQRFRNSFLKGWDHLLQEMARRRSRNEHGH